MNLIKIYKVEKVEDIYSNILQDLKPTDSNEIEIYNKYLLFFWSTETSLYTVRNKYTKIRELIKKSRFSKARKEKYLEVFKMNESLHTALNEKTIENTKDKLNDKVVFKIDTYFSKMQEIKHLITAKDFKNIRINRQTDEYLLANLSAVYLAMATGRRMWEIAKTLELSKKGKTVFYAGLIKKRDIEDMYEAFVLDDDYHFLKKCLENVRKYYTLENYDNSRFNNNYQKVWNKFVKDILDDKKMSYSIIRDMYTDVAISKLNINGEDEELFRAKVLAHETTRLSASSHYKKTKGE